MEPQPAHAHSPTLYESLEALPEGVTGEILDGQLYRRTGNPLRARHRGDGSGPSRLVAAAHAVYSGGTPLRGRPGLGM